MNDKLWNGLMINSETQRYLTLQITAICTKPFIRVFILIHLKLSEVVNIIFYLIYDSIDQIYQLCRFLYIITTNIKFSKLICVDIRVSFRIINWFISFLFQLLMDAYNTIPRKLEVLKALIGEWKVVRILLWQIMPYVSKGINQA